MWLKQYRGENFAVAALKTTSGPRFQFNQEKHHISVEVNTPVGGVFLWYRNW